MKELNDEAYTRFKNTQPYVKPSSSLPIITRRPFIDDSGKFISFPFINGQFFKFALSMRYDKSVIRSGELKIQFKLNEQLKNNKFCISSL